MPQSPDFLPKKILLATDLSGRGDRALDRATDLANLWDAELVVVHALEDEATAGADRSPSWRRPPDMAETVERQLRDDIRSPCPQLRIHVEDGPPLQTILEAVERETPDLLVVAMGRGGPRDGLSRTLDELFRRSPVSLLVVKRRPSGPYGHILVGTDYTEEARIAVEVSSRLFDPAPLVVMHAYEMPYRNLYLDHSLADRFGAIEQDTMRTWLAQADLPADRRDAILPLIEHGPPEIMLSAYAREKGADLTVIGAYERGRLFHLMVGGKGPRIVQAAPGDILVVRADKADASPDQPPA